MTNDIIIELILPKRELALKSLSKGDVIKHFPLDIKTYLSSMN